MNKSSKRKGSGVKKNGNAISGGFVPFFFWDGGLNGVELAWRPPVKTTFNSGRKKDFFLFIWRKILRMLSKGQKVWFKCRDFNFGVFFLCVFWDCCIVIREIRPTC